MKILAPDLRASRMLFWILLALGGSACTLSTVHSGEQPASNRLIHEKSPYLLQHAHNPVDWYPWGEEAFQKARRENKPIFLSVGYSTCHWCHVMERESFSNAEIAKILNRHFVSIKVDREERPDVDQVYMAFVQATTGSGGWPMSVFLTPELKPFFGGTYFPPEGSLGRAGFRQILQRLAEQWEENRDQIVASSARVTDALRNLGDSRSKALGERRTQFLKRAFQSYRGAFDSVHGGFGEAPKFPRPSSLQFLLRYWKQEGDDGALEMVVKTLEGMAAGGVRDHLGGGFHRYSTDKQWFLPHFEKMLYDQAQLAVAYLDAHRITSKPEFAAVAREILDYLLEHMAHPQGGFYSAEDADSLPGAHAEERKEGAFYVWSAQQIDEIVGEDAVLLSRYYGVQREGNVGRDPFGEFRGLNVLFRALSLEAAAESLQRDPAAAEKRLESARQKLLEIRDRRPRPLKDDKILTAWNGLAISAFARAYQVLGDEDYLAPALETARFLRAELYDADRKRLLRRYRLGSAEIDAFAEDYVYLVQGLLDLYESSLEAEWLLWAIELTETANRLFLDRERGGFFNTDGSDASILLRLKEDFDGALPTATSVGALNLLRLGQMANREDWRELGEQCFESFHERLTRAPQALPFLLSALAFSRGKPLQILIAGERSSPETRAILEEVHRRYLPQKIVVLADRGAAQRKLSSSLEVLDDLRRIDGKSTAYVCQDYVCRLPTNDPKRLAKLLEEIDSSSRF